MRTEVRLWNRALSKLGDLRVARAAALTTVTATAANPVVCTKAAHGYATGDLVEAESFVQMTQLNGRVFQVTVLTSSTFELDGEDGSAYTAETSGGRTRKLTARNGGALGKAGEATFDAWPEVRDEILRAHPWNCVTRYGRLARLAASKSITGATAASPVVLTVTSHGYSQGDQVYVENVGGMVELNDRLHRVGNVLTANTFELASEDGTSHTAYTSGGTAKKALRPLKPDSNYEYRYDQPADCLRVLELPEAPKDSWESVGREVYADEGITAAVRYCRQQKDVTRWDPQVAAVVVARLALEICEELTGKRSLREQLQAEFDDLLNRARSTDGFEQSLNELEEDDWVEARL